MTHLGLFEGIGGFSLAARWLNWKTLAWCEIDPFCQQVLKHHFPEAEGHSDITKTDFKKYANTIDVITGGFPCQPFSTSGKRKGDSDNRYLWPEMLRTIREVQPRYVVGENVRGLTNWNGGLVFDQVQSDLEIEGYEVLPFLLPACGVDAPHRRDRIWFIAKNTNQNGRTHNEWEIKSHSGKFGDPCTGNNERVQTNIRQIKSNATNSKGKGKRGVQFKNEEAGTQKSNATFASAFGVQINSNTPNKGLQGGQNFRGFSTIGKAKHEQPARTIFPTWYNFPTESPFRGRNDGVSEKLDGITFSKWANESLKAYGNAIVPQLAFQIFKSIQADIDYDTTGNK